MREGSLAGAARVLDMAPAVVTRVVGAPKQHQGARPINRSTRRMALTEIGEACLERTRRILDELGDADALSTGHRELMLAAAVVGLGIAGLPSFLAEQALRDGRLERLLPQWRGVSLRLHAAMSMRRHVPARTRVLADFLVQTFGGEDRDPWLPVDEDDA